MTYTFENFTAKGRLSWSEAEIEWLEKAVDHCIKNKVQDKRQFVKWCIEQGHIKRTATAVYQRFLTEYKKVNNRL